MQRVLLILLFAVGLWIASRSVSGQGAVSLGKPEHEDLTFWAHRRGLDLDFEGEAGFGDIARLLLRTRSNGALLIDLRDRFTFRSADLRQLDAPDLFHLKLTNSGFVWVNRPERFLTGVNQHRNLAFIVENETAAEAEISARVTGPGVKMKVPPKGASAAILTFRKPDPGAMTIPLDVYSGDKAIAANVTFDVRRTGSVRVRIVDESGRPSAARVYVTGSDGLAYTPVGSISRITPMSAEYFFHAQDSFTIELPAGSTRVEATRGPEYELSASAIDVEPGKTTEITLALRRWSNISASNWYAADSHIHMNYTQPHHQNMTPADMRLLAEAEDLHVPNFLVANSSGEFIHDKQYFEAKPHALSTKRHILYWNEEYRNGGVYGHMAFFRLRSLIEPFYTGFRGTPFADDYPANYWAAKKGKEQNAAVVYVHPGMSAGLDQLDWGASAKELPVDAALGVIDAMDVLSNNDEAAGMEFWYKLLNCGIRLGISAGTDSFVNVTDHYVPGGHRVFAHTNGPLNYDAWVDAYRQGRTFATNGPTIELTVDGKEPGTDIALPSAAKLKVVAKIKTHVPLDRMDIVSNGIAVISKRGIEKGESTITGEIEVNQGAWIAARAMGQRHRLVLNDTAVFAHTSPVYVTVGGKRWTNAEDGKFFLAWNARLVEMLDRRAKFSTPERKQEVLHIIERANTYYRKIAHPANN